MDHGKWEYVVEIHVFSYYCINVWIDYFWNLRYRDTIIYSTKIINILYYNDNLSLHSSTVVLKLSYKCHWWHSGLREWYSNIISEKGIFFGLSIKSSFSPRWKLDSMRVSVKFFFQVKQSLHTGIKLIHV